MPLHAVVVDVREDAQVFDESGSNDDDDEVPASKESTGRWTREEHHTFIKGLEMYGKGWKKIANLIKTRTVVQIRTHAQKYFLKLAKARQNGESGATVDGKPFGGARKKKRRRLFDRPLAVAPLLLPFVKQPEAPDPIDVDDGLYNFLSPRLPPSENVDSAIFNTDDNSNHRVRVINGIPIPDKPEWFQKGYHVEKLLKDAEALNWSEDSGVPMDINCDRKPEGTSSSSGDQGSSTASSKAREETASCVDTSSSPRTTSSSPSPSFIMSARNLANKSKSYNPSSMLKNVPGDRLVGQPEEPAKQHQQPQQQSSGPSHPHHRYQQQQQQQQPRQRHGPQQSQPQNPQQPQMINKHPSFTNPDWNFFDDHCPDCLYEDDAGLPLEDSDAASFDIPSGMSAQAVTSHGGGLHLHGPQRLQQPFPPLQLPPPQQSMHKHFNSSGQAHGLSLGQGFGPTQSIRNIKTEGSRLHSLPHLFQVTPQDDSQGSWDINAPPTALPIDDDVLDYVDSTLTHESEMPIKVEYSQMNKRMRASSDDFAALFADTHVDPLLSDGFDAHWPTENVFQHRHFARHSQGHLSSITNGEGDGKNFTPLTEYPISALAHGHVPSLPLTNARDAPQPPPAPANHSKRHWMNKTASSLPGIVLPANSPLALAAAALAAQARAAAEQASMGNVKRGSSKGKKGVPLTTCPSTIVRTNGGDLHPASHSLSCNSSDKRGQNVIDEDDDDDYENVPLATALLGHDHLDESMFPQSPLLMASPHPHLSVGSHDEVENSF